MEEEKELSITNIFGKITGRTKNKDYKGPLTINPISAKLTKNKDLFGKNDPYCVINIAG